MIYKDIARAAPWLNVNQLFDTSTVTYLLFSFLNKGFMAYVIMYTLFGWDTEFVLLPFKFWPFFRDINVLICIPNYVRQSSLVVMSNCSHYYGDIPEKSVFYQNQILDHPLLYPFQLFCCNFGATHIMHHYVPGQPFYIRSMCYPRVKPYMIAKGVRLNDFGTVSRANRYFQYKHNDITSATSEEVEDHKTPKKIETAYEVVSSNLLFMWIALCSSFGPALYVFIDQMVIFGFARRVVMKLISKGADV